MMGYELVNIVLFGVLAVTGLAITRMRGLYAAAMMGGLFSLVTASVFVILDAMDVAFTEAAVGAGISTVLYVLALALTRSREAVTPRDRVVPAAIVAVLAGAGLIYISPDLPPVGTTGTPAQTNPITQVYLGSADPDAFGIPNLVTSVLASFRGYDTLGEVAVIFAAGAGVTMLVAGRRKRADDAV